MTDGLEHAFAYLLGHSPIATSQHSTTLGAARFTCLLFWWTSIFPSIPVVL